MLLSLSETIAFWTLVDDTKGVILLQLTFEDPGPKELNYDKLPKKLQKLVDKALVEGRITQGKDT